MRYRIANLLSVLIAALLAGCSPARVQTPPPGSAPVPEEAGRASFFFPVEVPLAQVRRIFEETLPRWMTDERKQELAEGLREEFYRYTLSRGEVEVGFSGERLTFEFPVRGRLTVGGRLRPVPLGRGLPVQESVEFAGWIRGTALPLIAPDWRPDPQPTAEIDLGRAELKVLDVFTVSVRGFLEERLNPVLNQELRRVAGTLLADLALRKRAEEAWRALHVTRRALAGENLWLRFEPTGVSLARIARRDGMLRTGIGISGRVSLILATAATPPAPSPLPPLRSDGERAGSFEMEVPVAASAEELSRMADRLLRGRRFRAGRSRELAIAGASLGAEGDRLVLGLDFQMEGRPGRLVVRGRPVLAPGTNVLGLADLEYDLARGGLFLRLADRLHRAELLAALEKATRLDLAPILDRTAREVARGIGDLLPPGVRGEVRVEPVRVLGVGVAGGAVWARCRLAGTTLPLAAEAVPGYGGPASPPRPSLPAAYRPQISRRSQRALAIRRWMERTLRW